MAKVIRKVKAKARVDYTRHKAGCTVYTIECVLQHCGEDSSALEELSRSIDGIRQYGAAELVGVDSVSESWDDACKILGKRQV